MLKSLQIRNYALIEELSVPFSSGLVIITGETGAGKSIIVDALGLVLGERASSEAVRTGCDKAIVEGIFDVTGNARVTELLQANELDTSEEMIVRREVSARGQSRCFINDSPVTLALLKQAGEMLVDLHGQHEHQSLLRVDTHCGMVDDFGGLDGMVREYRESFHTLKAVAAEVQELRDREQQLREKRDFCLFQAQEIDAVSPQAGEEERLETDLRILENSEKLHTATADLHTALYEGDRSAHDLLVIARNQLHTLSAIDPQFADAARECASAAAIVNELAKFIQGYNARVEFAPDRLEELRDRLGRIAFLKKKYGGSIEAVIAHREAIGRDLELADNFDGVLQKMQKDLDAARAECALRAERLSVKRHEVGKKIDKAIVQELAKLGIAHARFTTHVDQAAIENGRGARAVLPDDAVLRGKTPVRLNARGYDDVEFYISTNAGEDEKPLTKVASGGEISRIMLALKSILARTDRLPVLIFDEIDVGVSGRIAQAVGASMKSLAGFHQVIAITHLPQIAGFADTHCVVTKKEQNGRASTSLRRLTLDEQVREVARLMSGAEVTEAGLAGARELMGLR
ncbi:MAG: DNA repair protein RecN [Ignavibacteriae bacterium]|nr:DNA repair protein RecN [Ignavibacteriota bacterium]